MDKVDGRLVQARPGPVLPLVDFTPVPYCRGARLGTCRLSSRLQGVGRPLSARPCLWPELAADSVRVSFPRLPGKHLPPRGSTTRSCIPRHRDSGVSAGCEIAATRAYASPRLVRVMPSAPFEIAVEASSRRSLCRAVVHCGQHARTPRQPRSSVFRTRTGDDLEWNLCVWAPGALAGGAPADARYSSGRCGGEAAHTQKA